ncbi:Helitron helicase [Phytophthora megakarya]|uniref:Helitron helicase n=1 Tax=Phytophthora megakarya TaxID=4795 RepID=A0A225V6Y3_9STRA|nr:Helitron helicase [Phytophthora megakarya]
MVHDAGLGSDNVPAEVDDADDDRRTRNVNALIDAMYPGINADDLPNAYFLIELFWRLVTQVYEGSMRWWQLPHRLEGVADRNLFEQEFLNSPNLFGIPPYRIALKVWTPIIMIRHLNSDAELCNGTRLRVVLLRERSIEATVMLGPVTGNTVFFPRITFYTEDDDKEFPFKLKLKPFPVVPAFAMTINKAQGQSSYQVGIYLESPVFSHGKLYVSLSRVTSRKAIKIAVYQMMIDEDGKVHTKNIVYSKILDHEVA